MYFVQGHCSGVCKEEVVRGNVRLRRRVPAGAVLAEGVGAPPWGLGARTEGADGLYVGLVHGDPVLHPVTEAPKADFCKSKVIFSATHCRNSFQLKICALFFVSWSWLLARHLHKSGAEKSAIFILKDLRKIEMVDGGMRLNPYREWSQFVQRCQGKI